MAAVKFRDLADSAKKFATNGQNAAPLYSKNAMAAAPDWHAQTMASEENYKAGVTRAANEGRFGRGVAKAGAETYRSGVATVGQNRFSEGMSKGAPTWSAEFGKVASVVAGKDIGPRGITGSQENKNRAANMADAWRAARMSVLGVTS